MNILFEGVNGSGKTTIINTLIEELEKREVDYSCISDLETNTPLNPVLKQMFSDSVFLEMNKGFKTSLFESLVLAADHHYIQEMHRADKGITIYDRDFISVLAYQKDIIKNDYEDWEEFFDAYRTIMTFNLKNIDLLCYVSIPSEENIARTEKRDGRSFSEEEKEMLESLKKNMEEEIVNYTQRTNTPLLVLDGRKDPRVNALNIAMMLKEISKGQSIESSTVSIKKQTTERDEI